MQEDMNRISYSEEELKRAHELSYANRTRLAAAEICGCFYCLKVFTPNKIIDWSLDEPDETAICPYCGIDAVLGDNEGYPLTKSFLMAMYEEWFNSGL